MNRVVAAVLFFGLIVIMLLLLLPVYQQQQYEDWIKECTTLNPCKTCNFTISCLEMEEIGTGKDNVKFRIDNKKNMSADCSVMITIKQSDVELNELRYIGKISALSYQYYQTEIQFPVGEADIEVTPQCR